MPYSIVGGNVRDLTKELLFSMASSDQTPDVLAWLNERWADFAVSPDGTSDSIGEHGCGIYFLWDQDDALLYVGQSLSMAARVLNHSRYGTKHATATFLEVPPPLLDYIEYAYIQALRPPINGKYLAMQWDKREDLEKLITLKWGEFER